MRYQHQNSIYRIRKNDFIIHSPKTNYLSIHNDLDQEVYSSSENMILENESTKVSDTIDTYNTNEKLIIDRIGVEAYNFINDSVSILSKKTMLLFSANKLAKRKDIYKDIVSLQSFNSINKIDSFLCRVNESMDYNGKFIGFVQTNEQRKKIKAVSKKTVLTKFVSILDFVFHRVSPKIFGLKHLYFGITQGKFQRLSKAEVLGRLIKFGFKIVEIEEDIDGNMYFVVKKVKRPDVSSKASTGILYKFPRVGKNGKLIGVYKIRTMHPYSEYLQDYIVSANGYGSDGKPANDFRVPSWAKFVRRYWLDEVPQLINVFKGEMKLFGVRPVTDRYFQDIPKHIQKLRLSHKPGCIPAYVAFNRSSSKDSVLSAEEDYLNLNKHGVLVDLKLIFLAIKNIIFNKKRGS
jgi:lipopolysaccharide/colanic/teichoic acid biosynthesis glycosyltransferase